MLAVKTGNQNQLPSLLLYKLYCTNQSSYSFDEDLVTVSNTKQKFSFNFEVEN